MSITPLSTENLTESIQTLSARISDLQVRL